MIDKRNTGILAVDAMACDAVMRECLFPIVPRVMVIGQRILLLLVAHKDVVFRAGHRAAFEFAGRRRLAAD